jgi:hypothetical protein
MVSSSSFPDRPSRRGGFGRGETVVGWSSVTDTMPCLPGRRMIRQNIGGSATRSCATLFS